MAQAKEWQEEKIVLPPYGKKSRVGVELPAGLLCVPVFHLGSGLMICRETVGSISKGSFLRKDSRKKPANPSYLPVTHYPDGLHSLLRALSVYQMQQVEEQGGQILKAQRQLEARFQTFSRKTVDVRAQESFDRLSEDERRLEYIQLSLNQKIGVLMYILHQIYEKRRRSFELVQMIRASFLDASLATKQLVHKRIREQIVSLEETIILPYVRSFSLLAKAFRQIDDVFFGCTLGDIDEMLNRITQTLQFLVSRDQIENALQHISPWHRNRVFHPPVTELTQSIELLGGVLSYLERHRTSASVYPTETIPTVCSLLAIAVGALKRIDQPDVSIAYERLKDITRLM